MLLIKAEQKYSRQSPQKVRLVAEVVRGLPLEQATQQLSVMNKKATGVVVKVLRQAVANATNNLGLSVSDLTIHEIIVNKGPIYRRFRAVSRGRGHAIQKPTCHVKVVLRAEDSAKVVKPKTEVPKAEVKSETTEENAVQSTARQEAMAAQKLDKSQSKLKASGAKQPRAMKKTVNRTTSK